VRLVGVEELVERDEFLKLFSMLVHSFEEVSTLGGNCS